MFIMVWTVLRYCIPLSHRLTLHRSTSTVVSPFQQRNKSSIQQQMSWIMGPFPTVHQALGTRFWNPSEVV